MIHKLNRHRGMTLMVLFIAITVVSILAMSIFRIISQVSANTAKHAERITTRYLAEAAIHRALCDIKNILARPLVTPRRPRPDQEQMVEEDLLELLDIDRARQWTRSYVFKDEDLVKGGEVTIELSLLDVSATPFSTFIDPLDKVPAFLDRYHIRRNVDQERQLGLSPLGGWHGKLRIAVEARFRKSRVAIETWREFHSVDITPPGSNYTLFIQGEEREYLKEGRFVLSNLNVPAPVRAEIHNLAKSVNDILRLDIEQQDDSEALQVAEKLNKEMDKLLKKGEVEDALKTVHLISKQTSDRKVKDTLDRIVLSLDPRDWGKVRTNGALFVHLPFFATDDIINYFVDATPVSRRRPEVGFLGHENRLHDPFLSIYTLFEGRIYKIFRRLRPLSLGPSNSPQEVPPQRYTINTKMNYPRMRPETRAPAGLERLRKRAKDHCQWRLTKARTFRGTKENPIRLEGIVYSHMPIAISGFYTGKGLLVTQASIRILSDLTPLNPSDRLSLVSLRGSIRCTKSKSYLKINAALCAANGLKGTKHQRVMLHGNLIVKTLRRTTMPRYFDCQFNAEHKNHFADNIVGVIARQPILTR